MEDYEKDALYGLTIKYLKTLRERSLVSDQIEALRERLGELSSKNTAMRIALEAMDVEPGDDFFKSLGGMLGADLMRKAYQIAGYIEEDDIGEFDDEHDGMLSNPLLEHDEQPEGNIKELVLRELQRAGRKGIRARDIIATLRKEGVEMHDKTVGMTLYRLALDKLARRDGRVWFAEETAESSVKPPADIFN